MAPPMHGVMLGAVAVAATLALHGCLEDAMGGIVDQVCETTMGAIANNAKKHYQELVQTKCQELAKQLNEKALSDNKSAEVLETCLNTAGADLTTDADDQSANFTQQCKDYLSLDNSTTLASMGKLTGQAQAFFQEGNFKGQLDGLLDNQIVADISKMKDKLVGEGEVDGDTEGDKGDDDDDGKTEGDDSKTKGDDSKTKGDDDDDDSPSTTKEIGDSTTKKGDSTTKKPASKSRLFDASIRLPVAPHTVAVPVMFGAVAAAAGLVAVFRRSGGRDHESLVNAEDSELAEA